MRFHSKFFPGDLQVAIARSRRNLLHPKGGDALSILNLLDPCPCRRAILLSSPFLQSFTERVDRDFRPVFSPFIFRARIIAVGDRGGNSVFDRLLRAFLEIFLDFSCPLCGQNAEAEICQACAERMSCYAFPDGSAFWRGDLPAFIWGRYGGTTKRAIAKMKYHDRPDIARPFGRWLGETWLRSRLARHGECIVVPIPMHSKKQKERGFNQAELIARSFCQVTEYPLAVRGLERVRATQALFSLSPEERRKMMKGAFALGRDFRHQRPRQKVLLLDDIFTTGSTCQQAAETLSKQGIRVKGAIAALSPARRQETR